MAMAILSEKESQEPLAAPEIEKSQDAKGESVALSEDIDPRIGEDRSEL